LDLQGQRELLAGIELEGGAGKAALARCNVERMAAAKYGDMESQRADAAQSRTVWVTVVTAIGSAASSAAVTAIVDRAVKK
jgi:hypothetical protein